MKTQTQVQIRLSQFQVSEHLSVDNDGYILKFFMSSNQSDSKPFKMKSNQMVLSQQLKIRNIVSDQLQIWFCTNNNKMIATSIYPIKKQGEQEIQLQFSLNHIIFAKLKANINVTKREIEKIVYVEPDQNLLKKQEDPEQVRKRQEEQARRVRQQAEIQKLARQQKKHAITITQGNQKDQPYV